MSTYSVKERNRIISALSDLGVQQCVIQYSGGGDSGSIDSISCYMAEDEDKDDPKDPDALLSADSDNAIRIEIRDRLLGTKTSKFSDQIESLCYALLDHLDVPDWVNNDGGQGTITIHPNESNEGPLVLGQIEVDHTYFVQESVDSSYTL
jgi:hypothetical protein